MRGEFAGGDYCVHRGALVAEDVAGAQGDAGVGNLVGGKNCVDWGAGAEPHEVGFSADMIAERERDAEHGKVSENEQADRDRGGGVEEEDALFGGEMARLE